MLKTCFYYSIAITVVLLPMLLLMLAEVLK